MKVITLLFFLMTSIASAQETIEDFSSPATEWRITDDGVMGGLSKGQGKINKDGQLLFTGTLSLENNGGFSSIRHNVGDKDYSAFKGIKLRVKGDGRTYKLRLTTDARYRSMEVSYQAEFETKKGEWLEVEIPFDKLEASFRGLQLTDKPFSAKAISSVGFILADKKPGKFALSVDWLKTY